MTRFQVITENHNGQTLYVLRDMHTSALTRICPALGANCIELRLICEDRAEPVAIINDLEFLDKLAREPSRFGIPILFPWPSGIENGTFKFQDKIIHLNETGVNKSRHHGFVNDVPWRVVRSDCDDKSAWVTCAIDSVNCGEMAKKYPSAFTLEMTWSLSANGLQITMHAKNTGKEAMPLGAGLHPYFSIPLGPGGSRQQCRLAADVGKQWNLDVIMKRESYGNKPGDVFLAKPTLDITGSKGTTLADTSLNHVFEARFPGNKTTSASVIDPANNLKITVEGSRDFGTWVFFTPPNRSAISLEPWTLTPNGFNLAAAGIGDTGMQILESGREWIGNVHIRCSPLEAE